MLKHFASFIAGVITALGLAAGAAAITITTDAPQDTRLAPAFGDKLRLGRNATTAEVKADLINYARGVVQAYENRQAVQALSPPAAFDPT